ncbi:MAG: M23 family metallopeptidase, partial [Pseudomonadota bacterium]|nr:M23 family metallopeptidase [Pseudomonadota bacterium]
VDGREGTRSRYAAESPHYRSKSRIGSSLYATAKDDGVPDYIINEMMRVYAFDVDFQRQVRTGDEFEVFYGNPITGSSTKRKVLLYSSLEFAGGNKSYYRFTTPDDGHTDYFDETGRSATKGLLRTPVSGARLTSGFGMRKHPLLGYSKMHAGVDFGVPHGTPIKAAGSGVIETAGRGGAYGNMVKIQHDGGYRTLYAHMSRIAEGIRQGGKVNQGQIIGYVGSTGRSTGPHLHYEVRVKDRPVNPMKIRVAGGRQLDGTILAAFKQHKNQIVEMMADAPASTQIAQNQ